MLYHYFDNLFTKLKHLLLYYPFLNVTKIANIIEAMRPKKGWEMCIKAAQAAEFLGDKRAKDGASFKCSSGLK